MISGEMGTEEQRDQIRKQLGLDQPWYIQYFLFLVRTASLDFGVSFYSGQSAFGEALLRVGPTVLLAALAMGLNAVVALLLGAWLGFRSKYSAFARFIETLVFAAQGIPYFVVSLILIQIFAVNLQVLPSIGFSSPAHWILPTVSLALVLFPSLVRVVTVNVRDALEKDFSRTARSQGASRLQVVFRDALPNALLSSAAFAGTQLGLLLGGSVIVENIFSWPGLGQLLVTAALSTDIPVVIVTVFFIAIMVFVVNAFTDLMFHLIDPRLRTKREH